MAAVIERVNQHRIVIVREEPRSRWRRGYRWAIERKAYDGWELLKAGRAFSAVEAARLALTRAWFIDEADRIEIKVLARIHDEPREKSRSPLPVELLTVDEEVA